MNKKSGFTILEVLMTIVLVVSGFLALLQALNVGLFGAGENENELVALTLAQSKMEEARSKTYASIINETKSVVPGFSVFQQELIVTLLQANLKVVTANVFWSVKSDVLNVSLTTYVSNI